MEGRRHVLKELIRNSIRARRFPALEGAQCASKGMLAEDIREEVWVSLIGSRVKGRSESEGIWRGGGSERIGIMGLERRVLGEFLGKMGMDCLTDKGGISEVGRRGHSLIENRI